MKQIVCPGCGQMFVPGDFTTRAVAGYPALKNMGLGCPHCGWFGHLFVEDERMRRYRATLMQRRAEYDRRKTPGHWHSVEKAREKFGRVFEETQLKWRPILGLTPFDESEREQAS
ncbi:MAG: hypothetical protein R3C43_19140 [Chloroflexota bacterium]